MPTFPPPFLTEKLVVSKSNCNDSSILSKLIVNNFTPLEQHIVNSLEDSGPLSNDVTELLLPAWRDLVVVMVARAKSWLADKQKVSVSYS